MALMAVIIFLFKLTQSTVLLTVWLACVYESQTHLGRMAALVSDILVSF